MHAPLNTAGGRFGFVAVYPGGRRIAENQATWDEVSRSEPILALDLVDFSRDTILFSLDGYDSFFFSNECMASGVGHQLTAKLFGGTNKGRGCVLVRVEIDGDEVRCSKREMLTHAFSPHALRPGVKVA